MTTPTSEPVATTEPAESPAPATTATPIQPATPTAAVAVQPTVASDSEPISPAAVPTGPVPSDDIVITGPDIDESETKTISTNGAAACAATEQAIEFLDRGDTDRLIVTLEESADFADLATESEIVAMAPELRAAGANEETAVTSITAMLNACAIYGYQV